MAKSKKEVKETEQTPIEQEVKPSFSSYIKAINQLLIGWIKTHKKQFFGVVLFGVILIGLIGYTLRPEQGEMSNDDVIIRVNKQLSISNDSNPVVLDVVDKSKASQPFLEQSENGDKVLLYYVAKKSVLYRPSSDQIIHQGTYTPPEAKIFIRKGTTNNDKVNEAKAKIEPVDGLEIISSDNSVKSDYKGITLVSVSDRYDEKLTELSKLFGVNPVRLPAGETFPEADILVIVGE